MDAVASGIMIGGAPATSASVAISSSSPFASLVATGSPFVLAQLQDSQIKHTELNSWYNGKGFNLESEPAGADGNLFNTEGRIWAFTLDADYPIQTSQGTNRELTIPKGTYFFTNPVFKSGNETNATKDNIDWLASTFIAVSSTETSESTDTDRAIGAGFRLITAKGSDFILHSNTSVPEGDDLSIWNASFIVEDNHSATHPYSIRLQNFYYKGAVNDADTEAQDHQTNIFIGVSGYNGTESRVVSMLSRGSICDLITSSLKSMAYNLLMSSSVR